jgi:hypothetical protein
MENICEARLYMFVYGEQRLELVRRHGIGAVIGDGPHLIFRYLNDTLLDIIEDILDGYLYESKVYTARSEDSLKVIDFIVSNLDSRVTPIVTSPEFQEGAAERVESIIGNIYHVVVSKNKGQHWRCDWGKLILALAVYLDISGLKARLVRRDRPQPQQHEGRLLEFMPPGPMNQLIERLRHSSVFEQIESWNQRNVTFSL